MGKSQGVLSAEMIHSLGLPEDFYLGEKQTQSKLEKIEEEFNLIMKRNNGQLFRVEQDRNGGIINRELIGKSCGIDQFS